MSEKPKVIVTGSAKNAAIIAALVGAGYQVEVSVKLGGLPTKGPKMIEDVSPYYKTPRKGKGEKARQRSRWNRQK